MTRLNRFGTISHPGQRPEQSLFMMHLLVKCSKLGCSGILNQVVEVGEKFDFRKYFCRSCG